MKIKVFKSFLYKKMKVTVFVSSCILLFSVACKKEDNLTTNYKSDFVKKEINVISELDYSVANLKEWQIKNDRIECLVSLKSRKINLLTRQLGSKEGNLEMKVKLGFFNESISSLNKNWAGFHIGSNSGFINKNNSYKQGINIGICTNGALFIGAPSPNQVNKKIIKTLKNGVELKLLISNKLNRYTIDFSAIEIKTGKVLGRISKRNIAPEQIVGDVALISNFENQDVNTTKTTKSVWFKNWELKGTKVIKFHKN